MEGDAASRPKGQSLTYGRGDSLTVETTALAVLAMLKNGQFTNSVNQSLTILDQVQGPARHLGQHPGDDPGAQGTGRRRRAAAAKDKVDLHHPGQRQGSRVEGQVTEENADVMQLFDLQEVPQGRGQRGDHRGQGRDEPDVSDGRPALRAVEGEEAAKPMLEVSVDYDRTKLSTADLLRAKATLKYNGKEPTVMVMLDLGIPPGFTVDAGDFAEMVAAKKVNKFSVTAGR